MYKVFYLVGGNSNFVCKSIIGLFDFENAKKEVDALVKMGYKAMCVKNGHIVGGYNSYTDFESIDDAKMYYSNL